MAGVLNNTARQFNLRTIDKETKRVTTVRLVPGLNDVPNEVWNEFRNDKFVNNRIKTGEIVHGKEIDERLQNEVTAFKPKITQARRRNPRKEQQSKAAPRIS